MKSTLPPAPLGDEPQRQGKYPDDDSPEVRFAEWGILEQNVQRFKQVLVSANRMRPRSHFRIFSVGSPRQARIVCTWRVMGVSYRKIFMIDVRDASCDFWIRKWDATPPKVFREEQ